MIQKHILRRLLTGFYLLQFCALILGLACYSYRAKELLVCWLLFCLFFAILALMFLGAVLAWYAGQFLRKCVSVARTLLPDLEARFAELRQEAISGLGILTFKTLKTPASPDASLDAREAHSGLLIPVVLEPMRVSESEQTLACAQTNIR